MSRHTSPTAVMLPAASGWYSLVPWQRPDGTRGYLRQLVVAWLYDVERDDAGAFATTTPVIPNDLTPPGSWILEDPVGGVTSADSIWPSSAVWAQEHGLAPDPFVPEGEAVLWPGPPERAA